MTQVPRDRPRDKQDVGYLNKGPSHGLKPEGKHHTTTWLDSEDTVPKQEGGHARVSVTGWKCSRELKCHNGKTPNATELYA